MECRIVDAAHAAALALPNDPFPVFGRLVPALEDGAWRWSEELLPPEEVTWMRFPEEAYTLGDGRTYLAAWDGPRCVGLAALEPGGYRYLYVYDLKVARDCRRKGVGRLMMRRAMDCAQEQGLRGLCLTVQDNNLAACRFYLSLGFEIGGFDNRIYRGTAQAGKADLTLYLDGDWAESGGD